MRAVVPVSYERGPKHNLTLNPVPQTLKPTPPPGPSALACEPKVEQLFVASNDKSTTSRMLETELMILRRLFEREIADLHPPAEGTESEFYPVTLSNRTIVYKGMLTPEQVPSLHPAEDSAHVYHSQA